MPHTILKMSINELFGRARDGSVNAIYMVFTLSNEVLFSSKPSNVSSNQIDEMSFFVTIG